MKNHELVQALLKIPAGAEVCLLLDSTLQVRLSSVSHDSEGVYLVSHESPEIINSNGDPIGTLDELIERDGERNE